MDGGAQGPQIPAEHQDRLINCEADLEPVFKALAEIAERAGWSGDEVATALVNLADNHVLWRMSRGNESVRIVEEIIDRLK